MAARTKDKRFYEDFLRHLGCESRKTKHSRQWFHAEKKFSIFIANTPRSSGFVKAVQDDVVKQCKQNFTKDEIERKVNTFKTSRQIKVLDDGRLRIGLFVNRLEVANGVDPETELLMKLKNSLSEKKRLQTSISEDNHTRLKNYAKRTNQTMGEVVEMMMARNTELFDEMLDPPM